MNTTDLSSLILIRPNSKVNTNRFTDIDDEDFKQNFSKSSIILPDGSEKLTKSGCWNKNKHFQNNTNRLNYSQCDNDKEFQHLKAFTYDYCDDFERKTRWRRA